MEGNGHLIKVLIHVFDDQDFQIPSKISPNPISLPVNPESFTRNFKVELNQQQGQGNQGTDSDFKATAPEELKLDFIFDGTDTIQGYKYNNNKKSVKDQLKLFMDAVYNMNGEIHRPHFLQVQWGEFMFPCILTNLDLNYTLFQPNGDPLRVKVSASFLNYVAQRERVAREGKKSPDLTHVRQVKGGDRLDNMTFDIYNNVKYVTQIAKANGLTSFRKIAPGTELVFPPLDKTSS
ncbi:hypothetical protein D1816_14755 [Aquimarina sp. AD10]|uniref:Contractile injection system tube protein N-terminal domain-containing protein n=1 Tax=Aquimarina aggregata TaxID=1642818 RepID=A0A162WK25_9FLAO|nr:MULTISPECIES: hypothetical protein [Aquimarina]AXT61555.1 hypothetical protein D1816_14755 [Aquimarina sp. AD10]KZS38149.1 hypothetical protein AWE51_19080 [Aquimarina aggregata]RKM90039.1 hypothetical protein D7033_25275 [Aquimarina sp. AD10]